MIGVHIPERRHARAAAPRRSRSHNCRATSRFAPPVKRLDRPRSGFLRSMSSHLNDVRTRGPAAQPEESPPMTAPRTVLLTGAAGGVGTLMRELLPPYGYRLRLFDQRPVDGEPDAITAELADTEALREAVDGVDAIVHLAGISWKPRSSRSCAPTSTAPTVFTRRPARQMSAGSSSPPPTTPSASPRAPRTAPAPSPSAHPAAPTPTTACPKASARISPRSTGTCTASRPSRSGSAPAARSRPRYGCCRSG